MTDDITQAHLDKARVRAAPATIPGSAGMVGTYDITEITRQTVRALMMPLDRGFTVDQLKEAQEALAKEATQQKLTWLEPPMIALMANPMIDAPGDWVWKLVQPVSGRIVIAAESEIVSGRMYGGMYVQTRTTKGFKDLRSLYMYCLGRFLPSRKQQLTRPLIYHRVVDGIETGNPGALTLDVFFPIQLSLKLPVGLLHRETMT